MDRLFTRSLRTKSFFLCIRFYVFGYLSPKYKYTFFIISKEYPAHEFLSPVKAKFDQIFILTVSLLNKVQVKECK